MSLEVDYYLDGSKYKSRITPLDEALKNFNIASEDSLAKKRKLEQHVNVTRSVTYTPNNEFSRDRFNYTTSLKYLLNKALTLLQEANKVNNREYINIANESIGKITSNLTTLASGRKTRRRIIDHKKTRQHKETRRKTKTKTKIKINIEQFKGRGKVTYQ